MIGIIKRNGVTAVLYHFGAIKYVGIPLNAPMLSHRERRSLNVSQKM